MIYSEKVKLACKKMFEAHKNDIDKGGYPYVFHPYALAEQMPDEDSVCTALLHDVVEDHGDIYTFDQLAAMGFGPQVIGALKLLTHREGVPYLDYVAEIKKDPIAARVKAADLKHNMDPDRIGGRKNPKYETYLQALRMLEDK